MGPGTATRGALHGSCQDDAADGRHNRGGAERTLRMQFELDGAGGRADQHLRTCGLPARHDVGLGESPAIAMARRAPAPSAAAWRRRRPRSTTCDCRDAARAARPPRRPGPACDAVRPSASRSMSPVSNTVCGPARTCSTQERSLSFDCSASPRVQPLEAHAVPGPAHAARHARPGRARRAPRRSRREPIHRQQSRHRYGAARVVEIVVARDQHVHAARPRWRRYGSHHHRARVAAAAERRPGVVDQHVMARLDDRGEPLPDVQQREARRTWIRWWRSPQARCEHQQHSRHAPRRWQRRQRSRRTDDERYPRPRRESRHAPGGPRPRGRHGDQRPGRLDEPRHGP